MAKYKIKVIQHLLKGNKIAKSGEIINGKMFIDLATSLKEGYCEEVSPKDIEVVHEEVTGLENMNHSELLAFAEENSIELTAKDKKSKASLKEAIKIKM